METTMDKLVEGYLRFHRKYLKGETHIFADLQRGQSPKAMVVACADSRVDPAILLQSDPGDLFVVRNVANLIPPCDPHRGFQDIGAALEFGVRGLNVKHIIVLGHSQCGGMQTLMASPEQHRKFPFVKQWVNTAQVALERVESDHEKDEEAERLEKLSHYALINSCRNLQTYPWIQERIAQDTIRIHAWYFSIKDATIYSYNAATDKFAPLDR